MALYVIAFIDRVNLGYAKHDFLRDTGVGEAAYAFGAGVFFVGYALFEVPSNLMLARVGARRWFCRIMVTWGLLSAGMMFAESARVFYLLRFLLGAAEAGFFPGVIYYLMQWYPQERRGAAMGLFYFGAPLAQIVGGPLSGALLEMNGHGGLAGWQWMFVVEGLIAVVAGLLVWRFLPDRPADALWLSASEREEIVRSAASTGSTRTEFRAGFLNRRVLLLGGTYLLIQTSVYGVTFYLPTQVAKILDRDAGVIVGLVSAIPWTCALGAAYVLPRLAARNRFPAAIGTAALGMAAVGIALSNHARPMVGLGALCLATAGFIGCQPIFWTFATRSFSGVQAAAGIALINSLGAAGGFLAPNLRVWAERNFHSGLAGVAVLALATLGAAAGFMCAGRVCSRARLESCPPSSYPT